MAFTLLVVLITCALIGIAAIAILNSLTMLRLQFTSEADDQPFVSILIPARNEAATISRTLDSLLAQTYGSYEIIVLDDDSNDNSYQIVSDLSRQNARLRVVAGKPLPAGWLGKNWACQQLSEAANGDYLIFVDADVRWQPKALSSVVQLIHQTNADLLTVWSTQETHSWSERIIVPLMAMVVQGYLPHVAVHRTPLPALAAANGQCMAFRRAAYEGIGGHATTRDAVVEDIQLARNIKAKGLRLRMVDGNQIISCRMYHGWSHVRNGYAKNIIAGYGDSLVGLIAGTIFHWLVFLFPYVWLVYAMTTRNYGAVVWATALIVTAMLIRALTATATNQRGSDALTLPVAVVLMSVIAAQAVWWRWRYGGPQWKNRTLSRKPLEKA